MNYDFTSHQHHSKDKFDPYDVLDLPRDSDKEAIKQRFRRLTRLHHPDRNKNNPDCDPEYYARICSAYEILSDPRKRAAYDQQHAPGWNTLRDGARSFTPAAPRGGDINHRGDFSGGARSFTPAAPRGGDINHRGDFSGGDLRRFNVAFEKSRAADPNDRGYGNQMVAHSSGTSIEDIRRARSMNVSPQNGFGGAKVSEGAFNARFEQEMKARRQMSSGGNRMMEITGDPLAWNGGISGGGGFSEVSIFDGMMVDRGVDDFTKTGEASLNYSDYMSGFNTFTDQLPESHRYYEGGDVKKIFNERKAQLSQIPDKGHNRSFAESEAMLKKRQEDEWAKHMERNKAHVLKYRDQYASDDLLPAPRVAPGGLSFGVDKPSYNTDVMDRHRPSSGGLSGGAKSRGGAKDSIPFPDPSAPFRPSTTSTGDAGQINSRMMNRMMDNARGSRPQGW